MAELMKDKLKTKTTAQVQCSSFAEAVNGGGGDEQ